MGFTLGIETLPRRKCPFWFSKTDSKDLFDHLFFRHAWRAGGTDVVGMIQERAKIDFAPLLKVASASCDRGEFPSKTEWEKQKKTNEAAWQSPAALHAFLDGLLGELARRPRLIAQLKLSREDRPYFKNGLFQSDLQDLRRMAGWAKQNGARKIRLVAG